MKGSRWIFGALLAGSLAAALWTPLKAQDSPIPAEVAALFDDIADIDKLRVLGPLKLTPDQIDRIVAVLEKSQREYNRALADAAVPPIRSIAKDIRETRGKMLTGSPIPKDFDEKVKKLQDEFVSRRNKTDVDTLKNLAQAVKSVLTPEQVGTAASLSRKALSEDGKPTAKGTDDQFFNFYVLNVLIKYPRAIPLLQDMKKAASGSQSASTGT